MISPPNVISCHRVLKASEIMKYKGLSSISTSSVKMELTFSLPFSCVNEVATLNCADENNWVSTGFCFLLIKKGLPIDYGK